MARLPSPTQPWLRLWAPLTTAVVAAVAAIAGAVYALLRAFAEEGKGESRQLSVLIGVALLAIVLREVLQVYRSFVESHRQRELQEVHDVHAACQVLREQLASAYRNKIEELPEKHRPASFRVCVYRVASRRAKASPELERVTRYCVGENGDPGEAGKRVSSACGVIGLAYRTGQLQFATREAESIQDFREVVIRDWGFDPEDAKTLNETRWSVLAIPIRASDGKVDTVVFIDSELRNCFADDIVQSLVLPACEAIKLVIERRYGDDH